MNKILLLEDDPNLGKVLVKFLEKNGYKVDWAKNGEEAIDLTYKNKYLIYLFDINVPLVNGDDLLLSLREAGDKTPCILITALVDIDSIKKGFSCGADDYIKKPFEPDELLIRIKAKTNNLKKSIVYKDFKLVLDEDKIYKNGELLNLSLVQKNIFKSLLLNYPNPSTKDELLELLESPSSLALRVNIAKLKQKLSIEIENIRNIGYKLKG